MFEKLMGQLLEHAKDLAAAAAKQRVDPAGFNDPVAMSTEWTPTGGGGGTRALVAVGPERMEFKASWGVKLFSGIFLSVGLSCMFAIPLASWNQKHIDPVVVLNLGFFGLVFGGIGARIYFGARPTVFDRRIGCCWKGRNDPSKEFDRSNIKSLRELSELHALQLVSELSARTRYSVYEMNMVFKDGSRQNIVRYPYLARIRKDARTLGSFLQVPLWDAVR